MIAARILTIASMLLASMERLALTELEALVVDVRLERLDYCAIWTMLALQTPATPMPYVKQVPSTVHSLAHAHKATKDPTVLRILTNVSKVF